MALLKRSFNAALLDKDDDSYPSKMPGSLARTTAPVAKMMRLWNYKEGAGLGTHGQGIIVPIKTERRSSNAGIGHSEKPYDNGLPGAPASLPAGHKWGEWAAASRALRLERDCCEKTLALLRDVRLQGDDSAETADALAAIVKSEEVLQGKRALGAWRAALPPSAVQHIVERVLAPRMAMKAREWEPVWNPGCDHWLRPWLPLIGNLPESLYGIVESKISGGSYDTISPWKDYFDPAHWEIFSRRHVLPRMTRWLQQLRITPPKPIDVKFRTVMEWTPLVRTQDVVSILEQEFFGKWESALRHWLQSAKPSLGEADAWCTGWKNLFTPELLDDKRVLARLEAGVAMVDRQTEDLNRLVCHS
uniref:Tuftelin-interacting protein 11 n=1 Tax=Aegilops tauschii TaxID=37682 RepID=M8B305_AEGTA